MEKDDAINIGGVDVSECPYLTYELEEDGFYYHFCDIAPVGCSGECRYINDCHYKQFKRIENERNELQERLTQAEEDIKSECLTLIMKRSSQKQYQTDCLKYSINLPVIVISIGQFLKK